MNKIKKYIKERMKEWKKLKKKLENKNTTIQEQADTINFLIQEMNEYKNKCIDYERNKKDLKSQIKFLTERDNKLQQIEQMYESKEIDLKKLDKIVRGK